MQNEERQITFNDIPEVLSQKFLNNRNSIANALNNSKLRKGKQKVAGRY